MIAQHTTAIRSNLFNEIHFQFARRSLFYGFSDLPGGSDPAVNIAGAAYIGREPFSTEDRLEKRYQITDDLTWTKGKHTLKFGVDFNFIQLKSPASQIFTLNYGGVYDFGSVSIANGAPSLTPVQAYGFGTPTIFFQGIGTSNNPFNNKLLGVFAQDSWKINVEAHLELWRALRHRMAADICGGHAFERGGGKGVRCPGRRAG